eukprot:3039906-Pleurochrysis_carterae.AAC.1
MPCNRLPSRGQRMITPTSNDFSKTGSLGFSNRRTPWADAPVSKDSHSLRPAYPQARSGGLNDAQDHAQE